MLSWGGGGGGGAPPPPTEAGIDAGLAELHATLTSDTPAAAVALRSVAAEARRQHDWERAASALSEVAAIDADPARRLESAVVQGRPLAQVDRDCFAVWVSGVDDPQTAAAELQAVSESSIE